MPAAVTSRWRNRATGDITRARRDTPTAYYNPENIWGLDPTSLL